MLKENCELEKSDLEIEDDILIADDNPNVLCVYFATYFDVDRKVRLKTAERDDEWMYLYADYDTEQDSVRVYCTVQNDDKYRGFEYTPTENEACSAATTCKNQLLLKAILKTWRLF